MFVFSIRGVPDSVRAKPSPSMADVLATKAAMRRRKNRARTILLDISNAHPAAPKFIIAR